MYASNHDLSPAVQKAHPTEHGQTAFREAFNSALHQYGNEEDAFKVAHHAADQAEIHGPAPHQIHVHIHPPGVKPPMHGEMPTGGTY